MERAKWSSSFMFILAAIGSAIGIGNIWRFPYIFGQQGGAAFLIPYFVCVLVIGFPLMLLETAAGRQYNASLVEIFKKLKVPKPIAWFPVILGFLILSYYIVITSWTLLFSGLFLMNLPADFSAIQNTFLVVPFFLAVILMVFLVERRGIKEGVENAVKYLMPVLLISLVLLVFFSLSQENAIANTTQYFTDTFNMNSIWNLEIWLFAASQVLFSLFVGYGIMLTYGSYLQKDAKIIPMTAIIIFADVAVSLLAVLL
ncbi:MAG: sodium-dependent transporter, partial [Candidatus Diapherotrites archaeon]